MPIVLHGPPPAAEGDEVPVDDAEGVAGLRDEAVDRDDGRRGRLPVAVGVRRRRQAHAPVALDLRLEVRGVEVLLRAIERAALGWHSDIVRRAVLRCVGGAAQHVAPLDTILEGDPVPEQRGDLLEWPLDLRRLPSMERLQEVVVGAVNNEVRQPIIREGWDRILHRVGQLFFWR